MEIDPLLQPLKSAIRAMRRPTPAVLAVALVVIALWPTVRRLWLFWLAIDTYHYAPLVCALCLVWLQLSSGRVPSTAYQPSVGASGTLVAVMVLWAVAYLSNVDILQQLLLPLAALALIGALCGREMVKVCTGPIAALYLAIPWWDYLLPLLQQVTIVAAERGMQLIGVPAKVTATVVTIPEGRFEIAEGCAGKNYFINAVTLAALGGAYLRLPKWRWFALIACAAMLAMVTNWLRVIVIILAGHLTNMTHYLVATEHLTLGRAMMFALFILLALLANRLSRQPRADDVRGRSVQAVTATVGSQRNRMLLLTLPLLLAPLTLWLGRPRLASSPGFELESLPIESGDWTGPLPADRGWQPVFRGAAAERRARYVSSAGGVDVYINLYGSQREGSELVSYNNHLVAADWRVQTVTLLDPGEGAKLRLETATDGDSTWLVGHAYRIGHRTVYGDLLAQLAYGFANLSGRPASGVVAIAARCAIDCRTAETNLQSFWRTYGNRLLAAVPEQY